MALAPSNRTQKNRPMAQPPGTPFSLDVHPRLPPELQRLEELANNLWFSWDRHARSLFARLDPEMWDAVGHSPKALLKSVDQSKLQEAAQDPVFLHDFDRVMATYDAYHSRRPPGKNKQATALK